MFRRLLLIAVTVSILSGVLIYNVTGNRITGETYYASGDGESWAVLIVDEGQEDRLIRESLSRAGLGTVISESSLDVAVDNFGQLKKIPLDSYRQEISAFDPRDDGYAARLRSFFVRQGERFFFLPLEKSGANSEPEIKNRLADLFEETPYSLLILEQREASVYWRYALYPAACIAALIMTRSKKSFALALPVILALCMYGASAFAFAALLTGILEILREPARELSAARYYGRNIRFSLPLLEKLGERFKSFRTNWLLFFLFLLAFIILAFMADLPPLPSILALTCFLCLFYLSSRLESSRILVKRHILFTPVPLLPQKSRNFSLFPLLLPFGIGAVLFLLVPRVFPGHSEYRRDEFPINSDNFITSDDYERHLVYQASFSYTPLNQSYMSKGTDTGMGRRALNQEGYLRYYLGEDGLIGGSVAANDSGVAFPPFPLEKLTMFLVEYNEYPAGSGKAPGIGGGSALLDFSQYIIKEWIPVIMILLACMFNLLRLNAPPEKQYLLRSINRKKRLFYPGTIGSSPGKAAGIAGRNKSEGGSPFDG